MVKKINTAVAEEKLLTEVELKLMKILWVLGEGTINDVLAALPPERKLAYTSVSTIIRILEQKNIVASEKHGRSHLYRPLLTKERYEEKSLGHLVNNVFDGAPASLVRSLLQTKGLKKSELSEIRQLLDQGM